MNNEPQQLGAVNALTKNWSESHTAIFKALIAAQPKFEAAKKESYNPHYESHYADFLSVITACKAALSAANLAFTHLVHPSANKGEVIVECLLFHESGEWISSTLIMHLGDTKPIAYGSAITYCKRYTLSAILGIATEDDDATAAGGEGEKRGGKKAAPAQPTKTTATAPTKTAAPEKAATSGPNMDGLTPHQKVIRQVQDKLDAAEIDHKKLIEALRAKNQIPPFIANIEQVSAEILSKCLQHWDIFVASMKEQA